MSNPIIKTLRYISNNPGCSSSNLDAMVVQQLFEAGLVSGADTTSIDQVGSRKYINLKITFIGSEHLSNTPVPYWHSSPLITGFISLLVLVALAGITFYLGWL